jgi:DNA-binding NarL/FixJ family response regulator
LVGVQISDVLREEGFDPSIVSEHERASGNRKVVDHKTTVLVAPALDDRQIDRIESLRKLNPDAAIVVVSDAPTFKAMRDAVDAGADGVVQTHELAAIGAALRAALAGQITLPRSWRDSARPLLSPREKQVLAMLVMGFSNSEIAAKLFVSESTVKSHVSSAFSRLGVRSRSEAAALILDPDRGLGTGILTISH